MPFNFLLLLFGTYYRINYMAVFQILWGLLNIALLISALGGLLTGFRPLRKRFGSLGAILPLIVMAAMCQHTTKWSRENKGSAGDFQAIAVQAGMPDDAFQRPYTWLLDELTTFDIKQSVYFSRLNQSDSIQVKSSTFITGFVSGLFWSPASTVVNLQSGQRFYYKTTGVLEWQLLGFPLYKQPKQFEGNVKLSKLGFL